MKGVFLVLFTAVTAVHLCASARRNTKLRNATKPFILLSLLGFYCFAARDLSAVVILALLFSWLGDVLLIPKGTKWFAAGGVAFMVSHAFFIAAYREGLVFAALPPALVLLPILFFTSAAALLFAGLKPYLPGELLWPILLYLLINGAMNCFAVFRCVSLGTLAGFSTAAGAALFFLSDSLLFFIRFKKSRQLRTHFPVMLCYSLGELLIVWGLL